MTNGYTLRSMLAIIRLRKSSRNRFAPSRPVDGRELGMILEAGRLAPTAHNMQNFEVIVVDDKKLLREIGRVEVRVTETFIRENYLQLAPSKEEIMRRKTGLLASWFPPSWRKPDRLAKAFRESKPEPLSETIDGSPTILIIIYDPRKRAPDSDGDALGFMSLGCVLENMWLMATSLNLGFAVMSVFSSPGSEKELKRILNIPAHLKIASAVRLGHPAERNGDYLRVRRDMDDFAHHNRFGVRFRDA